MAKAVAAPAGFSFLNVAETSYEEYTAVAKEASTEARGVGSDPMKYLHDLLKSGAILDPLVEAKIIASWKEGDGE